MPLALGAVKADPRAPTLSRAVPHSMPQTDARGDAVARGPLTQ